MWGCGKRAAFSIQSASAIFAINRIEKDLFVIWNSSDPSTDVYLSAAFSVAKALLFSQSVAEKNADADLRVIERSVRTLESKVKALDKMETWTTTIQSNSGNILKVITKLREAALDHVEELRKCLAGC